REIPTATTPTLVPPSATPVEIPTLTTPPIVTAPVASAMVTSSIVTLAPGSPIQPDTGRVGGDSATQLGSPSPVSGLVPGPTQTGPLTTMSFLGLESGLIGRPSAEGVRVSTYAIDT